MAATVKLRAFPSSKQLDCPHCHKPVVLYDPDGSEYVVCESCNSYCRVINHDHLQVQQSISPIKYEHVIEIGNQGTLKGETYKMIAYMEKEEAGTQYEWREYMLYSYTKGYAFLAEYNGHWSFIAGIQHYPELANAISQDSIATLDDVDYREYNRYTPVITALKGEFDWDAYAEKISAREFVAPPYMLVREKNKQNEKIIDWYLGEYIEPKDIQAGFNVPADKFPEIADIGAIQPNPYKKRWQQTLRISVVALVLVVVVQIFFAITRQNQFIMSKPVPILLPPLPLPKTDTAKHDNTKRDTTKRDTARHDSSTNLATNTYIPPSANGTYEFLPQRTSSFTIADGPAPVNVALSANVDNNWFESTVELVSDKDNQTWDVTEEIEYYHGYDDGDSWSEGSTSNSVVIDDVPAGRYHLNIYPYAGVQALDDVSITVTANVILWQNLLITVLLLCLVPLCFWYFQRRYEVNRWMNSDFSPYKKTTSDD